MSTPSTTDELEKHVQKKYEILAKLGKGVSIQRRSNNFPFESIITSWLCINPRFALLFSCYSRTITHSHTYTHTYSSTFSIGLWCCLESRWPTHQARGCVEEMFWCVPKRHWRAKDVSRSDVFARARRSWFHCSTLKYCSSWEWQRYLPRFWL